jgi:hypothetical protein
VQHAFHKEIPMILSVDRNKILRVSALRGATVEVLEGAVWVTEAGFEQDACVQAGGRYRIRGDGLVLVGTEGRQDGIGPRAKLSLRPAAGRTQAGLLRHLGITRLPAWGL